MCRRPMPISRISRAILDMILAVLLPLGRACANSTRAWVRGDGHASLSDIDAELEEFSMDPRRYLPAELAREGTCGRW